jgi:hypothetical protein
MREPIVGQLNLILSKSAESDIHRPASTGYLDVRPIEKAAELQADLCQ